MTNPVSQISSFSRREIIALFKSTQMRLKKEGLDLRLAPSEISFGRILIVIPKKCGSAPLRNKLKRRLKSFFYEQRLYEKKIDIIVYASPEATKLSYQTLGKIISGAFYRFEQRASHSTH